LILDTVGWYAGIERVPARPVRAPLLGRFLQCCGIAAASRAFLQLGRDVDGLFPVVEIYVIDDPVGVGINKDIFQPGIEVEEPMGNIKPTLSGIGKIMGLGFEPG